MAIKLGIADFGYEFKREQDARTNLSDNKGEECEHLAHDRPTSDSFLDSATPKTAGYLSLNKANRYLNIHRYPIMR
ncbi:hypothetical protein [Sphaerothrix gracilis]|uniref:hypothetical protein n=1 Tax=Sphaerothrix gracilis TaxID=3151835 RepID=UPI0031FC8D41